MQGGLLALLIMIGIIGVFFWSMKAYIWLKNRQEAREDRRIRDGRDEHSRNNRIRMRDARNQNNTSIGTRNNGPSSNARSNNDLPSSSVQSFTQPSSLYVQHHIKKSQCGRSRTIPTQEGIAKPAPTEFCVTPSAPQLSNLSDQIGKPPREMTTRTFHQSPNLQLPPPSYRDLFPSESSSEQEAEVP